MVFPLYSGGPFDPQHPISDTITSITLPQVADLVGGHYYVNVHTDQYSDGEIRGQLGLWDPPGDYQASLSSQDGIDENAPAILSAENMAWFKLKKPGFEWLHHEISATNAITITSASFYSGWPGSETLTLLSGDNHFVPPNHISGDARLEARDLLDLLTGFLYARVQTGSPTQDLVGQVIAILKTYMPVMAK